MQVINRHVELLFRILLASASISGILALIALLLSLDQLVRTCRKLRSSHTRVNTGAVTLTLLVISLLSLLSWRINLLTIVLTPEDNTLNANSVSSDSDSIAKVLPLAQEVNVCTFRRARRQILCLSHNQEITFTTD